jgi:RNA polymerase sigma-70 factor, ECF subfamily
MPNDNENKRKTFEDAYDQLFEPIFKFLYVRLNDRERAKELAQETFMKTWMRMADGHKIYALQPFLYTTAYNLFKNELRANRKTVSLETLMEENNYELHSKEITPEEHTMRIELLQGIDELPPQYRESLVLRYKNGLPVKEIANMLMETPSTVSVRIHRGLAQLRKRYEILD